jgi:hypothetical protein
MATAWKEVCVGRRARVKQATSSRSVRLTRVRSRNAGPHLVEFRISEAVARDMRWLVGDFVTLVESPDGKILGVTRTGSAKGYKLTPANAFKGSSRKLAGKTAPVKFRATLNPELERKYVDETPMCIDDPLVDGDVLVIGEAE